MRPNKKNMRYKEIFTCFSGMDMLESFQIKGSSLRETVADTRHLRSKTFIALFLIGVIGVFFIFLKKAACTGKQKGEWI